MPAILDDRVEELVTMKAIGERCMAEASERRDDRGFIMWQRCVTRLDAMIAKVAPRN